MVQWHDVLGTVMHGCLNAGHGVMPMIKKILLRWKELEKKSFLHTFNNQCQPTALKLYQRKRKSDGTL